VTDVQESILITQLQLEKLYLKLIHLVEDKIHARATGPYSMITEQPLAKSQKVVRGLEKWKYALKHMGVQIPTRITYY
jgi:hypothetical protein